MPTVRLRVERLQRPGVPSSINLHLEAGQIVSLEGPSGSGKSLLLRAIVDLDEHEAHVQCDGTNRADIPAPQWRRLVGYVPAEPAWWDDEVRSHFADWSLACMWLEPLGLPPECGDWPVSRASTGERQRLALIRALVLGPKVLLLDEATASLDPQTVRTVESVIRAECHQAGLAVLWVTHDPAQADRIADRRLRLGPAGLSEMQS